MKTEPIKKVLLYLVIAFVVVSVWSNPTGSADAAAHFLGVVGNFFSELIDRTATFVKGLTD